MTGIDPAGERIRELQLLGRTRDGAALVFAADGERFVLRTGDTVLAALGATVEPEQPSVSLAPREIQDRIRHGESAAAIALDTGMAVAAVERYAGPVLAEREHQARRAAACPVRERTLGELVALHTLTREPVARNPDGSPDPAAGEPDWNAWLEPVRPGVTADPVWRVLVRWPSGRAATFAWRPATRILRALDPLARAVVEDEATDLLDAVLRPIRSGLDVREDTARTGAAQTGAAQTGAAQTGAAQPRPDRGRRAQVPSWEEITNGSRPND